MELLLKRCTGRNAFVTFVVFVLFTAVVLPSVSSFTLERIGDFDSPDTMFFYSPSKLYSMAKQYGEEGRNIYVLLRVTFDLVWPVVYATFLFVCTAYFYTKLHISQNKLYVLYFSVSAFAFDILENLSTSMVMINYPNKVQIFAFLAPVFTMLKWSTLAIAFVILIVLFISWITRFVKGSDQSE